MNIGERLYYWRNLKQTSVYKLSKISGVSENHIRNLEKGKKQPTIKTLQAITDGLNITLSEFFNTENNDITYLSDIKIELSKYKSINRINNIINKRFQIISRGKIK